MALILWFRNYFCCLPLLVILLADELDIITAWCSMNAREACKLFLALICQMGQKKLNSKL
jgi:Na+-driven multidrug efflux pump